ncbi:hypothetical protein L6164_032317 [Bauhinia variegata]|uniref:Uncharacterized protein n=1 Tax=Bauhinia variegata TaxID=167791 RepID=A0ACB9KNR1_BAUVA|nr:hypothetical protein L6164_032317 [Bauhinia variegata]
MLRKVLLKIQKSGNPEVPITDDCIKAVIWDVFGAGTDTTIVAIEWAMTEMMRNDRVRKKAQAEIREALVPEIPSDLKKNARSSTGFSALQKKLFCNGSSENNKIEALIELNGNSEPKMETAELKLLPEEKNKEVKSSRKGREAEVFVVKAKRRNQITQEQYCFQISELKQEEQVIPALQKQIHSFTAANAKGRHSSPRVINQNINI